MKRAILQIFTTMLVIGLFCGAAAAAPIAEFSMSPNTGTAPLEVHFTDLSQNATTVNWNFGDGTIDDNNRNTSHVYSVGSYNVTMTATSDTGVNRTSKPIIVSASQLIADFKASPTEGQVPLVVNFTQESTGDIATYNWDFGDGTNSSEANPPAHTYNTANTYPVKLTVFNSTGGNNSKTTNIVAKAEDNSSGRRIWEDGMPTTYTWNAQSFSGFYYDLDSGVSSEEMTIKDIGSSIDSDDIVYSTKPAITKFEYEGWGSYNVIGFMAEKYFAGYFENSSIDSDVSPISNGVLSKILIDNDDKKSVSSQDSLALEEGYSLSIKEVDVNGKNVWVSLQKDGKEVANDFVSSDGNFIYKTDLGKAKDVPIIVVHFGSVFQGAESSAAFIQGVFQISSNYQEVKNGDNIGEMEVTSISSSEIKMKNTNSIGLDKGDTVDLMGKIKIQVADSDTLRFAPIVDTSEAGTYELRGTVYDADKDANRTGALSWTPLNFEGFYYNIDEGIATENLTIQELNGRTIPTDKLVYTSEPQPVKFEYGDWGNFTVVGFMANKYFAGYPNGAVNGKVDRISLLSSDILSKVLTDSDDKKSMTTGSALTLEEGYSMNIKEVDVNGKSVMITLEKDGKEVDNGIVTSGDDYVYKTDLGSAKDVPLIIVHFGSVFQGQESSAVYIQGIFQISDSYEEVKDGETFDKMEITGVSESGITMKNSDSIGLDRGEDTTVMNNVSFKTADSDTVRFYPFVKVEGGEGNSSDGLVINVPDEIVQGNAFDITVTAGGNPVEGATVKVNGNETGKTSTDGLVQYTAENTGSFKLTAEKSGYTTANKDVNVIPPKDEMSLSVSPDTVYVGDNITITALKKIGGEPIEGVNVSMDNVALGSTGSDGTIAYKAEKNGTLKVSASKEGFNDNSIDVKVKDLEAVFTVSGLKIDPSVVNAGKNTTISASVQNTGNAAGKYKAVLSVNGNATDSKEVSLDVGENTTVTFEHGEKVPGNYTVDLGGETATYTVKEQSSILLYVLGAFVLLIIGGAAYFFTKGGGDIATLQEKVQELINSIKPKK
jgi:S-layer protein (TIGR01567 family)